MSSLKYINAKSNAAASLPMVETVVCECSLISSKHSMIIKSAANCMVAMCFYQISQLVSITHMTLLILFSKVNSQVSSKNMYLIIVNC